MSAAVIATCDGALRSRVVWQSVFKEKDEIWFRASLGDFEGLTAFALIQFDVVKVGLRASLSLELYETHPRPVKTPELDSERIMPKWAVNRAKALRRARAGYVKNLDLPDAFRDASILNAEQVLRLDQLANEIDAYVFEVEKFLCECGYPVKSSVAVGRGLRKQPRSGV